MSKRSDGRVPRAPLAMETDMPDDQVDKAVAEIRAIALKVRDEMLAESILCIAPYLEPGEMDGVSFKYMEKELPEIAIERAKERMLHDLQIKIAKHHIDDTE